MLHEPSARGYLIRAIYEWCLDQGYAPYLAVYVDQRVEVPADFVKDDQIVLNISPGSTADFHIDNDMIHFKARFNGVSHHIFIPVDHVLAVYARETTTGLSFPLLPEIFADQDEKEDKKSTMGLENEKKSSRALTRPHLHRVK